MLKLGVTILLIEKTFLSVYYNFAWSTLESRYICRNIVSPPNVVVYIDGKKRACQYFSSEWVCVYLYLFVFPIVYFHWGYCFPFLFFHIRVTKSALQYFLKLQSESHRNAWKSLLVLIFTRILKLPDEKVSCTVHFRNSRMELSRTTQQSFASYFCQNLKCVHVTGPDVCQVF